MHVDIKCTINWEKVLNKFDREVMWGKPYNYINCDYTQIGLFFFISNHFHTHVM